MRLTLTVRYVLNCSSKDYFLKIDNPDTPKPQYWSREELAQAPFFEKVVGFFLG
jgi:hypothetical protein